MTVEQNSGYEILEEGNSTTVVKGAQDQAACIPTKNKEVFTVRIRPKELGEINITVSAVVDEAAVSACPNTDKVTKR